VARARNIKPGLFKNEVLGVADPLFTLLFEGLWLLADRAGRLEDRPLRIKAEVFPYRDGLDMASMLSWLEQHGFVRRYSSNGLALIQIIEFVKHQNPHKNEPESIYPAPEAVGISPEKIGSAHADSGFRIPDSGLLISGTSAPASAPPPPTSKPKRAAETPLPADFAVSERVRKWAASKGYGQLDAHLEAFKRKATAKDYRYASWDDAFMEAIREDWAKLRGRTPNGSAPPPDGGDAQWHETRKGIEARGIELGIGPYVETEQFPAYKARVMAAHQQGAH
jgi:hypothetical protein